MAGQIAVRPHFKAVFLNWWKLFSLGCPWNKQLDDIDVETENVGHLFFGTHNSVIKIIYLRDKIECGLAFPMAGVNLLCSKNHCFKGVVLPGLVVIDWSEIILLLTVLLLLLCAVREDGGTVKS